jgi:hypothetical protein
MRSRHAVTSASSHSHTFWIGGTRDELWHCRSGAWPSCSLVPLGRASRTPRGVLGRGAGFSSLRDVQPAVYFKMNDRAPAIRHFVRCSCPRGPFSRATNPRAGPIRPYGPCQGLARLVVHRHPIAPAGVRFDALRWDELLGSDRPYRKRRYGHPAGHLVACLVREDPFRLWYLRCRCSSRGCKPRAPDHYRGTLG